MTFNRLELNNRVGSPVLQLATGLVAAVVLLLLPARWTAPIKGAVATVLRPGQLAALTVRQRAGRLTAQVKRHLHTTAELAQVQQELERLRGENRRLKGQLAASGTWRAETSKGSARDQADRLLSARCIRARVLGQQARAFLQRHQLLDVGSQAGVEPDALVVDASSAVIDRGSDADLTAGRLVLSLGRVWGKVAQVGPYTSVVHTVTEPGYRDLVRLAGPGDGADAASSAAGRRPRGPQGILEGTGEPLARIRLVEVTEPVTVGDLVYTAAGDGVLPEPLLYGRIVRLEQPVGAAHWEIWMEPAVAPGRIEQVAVLQAELNPLRLGSKRSATHNRR